MRRLGGARIPSAILAIHHNQFGQAQQHIDKTRDLLDTELTALVGESYNRSYKYARPRTLISRLFFVCRARLWQTT